MKRIKDGGQAGQRDMKLPGGADQGRVAESKSCVGCKFLYGAGSGYSNYTWEETYVRCALNKNPKLEGDKAEQPYDWNQDPSNDNWEPTQNGRCESFKPGPYLTLDVDRECWPREWNGNWTGPIEPLDFQDDEQLAAIFTSDSYDYAGSTLTLHAYKHGPQPTEAAQDSGGMVADCSHQTKESEVTSEEEDQP